MPLHPVPEFRSDDSYAARGLRRVFAQPAGPAEGYERVSSRLPTKSTATSSRPPSNGSAPRWAPPIRPAAGRRCKSRRRAECGAARRHHRLPLRAAGLACRRWPGSPNSASAFGPSAPHPMSTPMTRVPVSRPVTASPLAAISPAASKAASYGGCGPPRNVPWPARCRRS